MKPKKKTRKIKAFDNWLLGRDGSSRISTFPGYFATLENSNNDSNLYKTIMSKFDLISDTAYFYKFNRYFNYGMSKDSKAGDMVIQIGGRDIKYEIIDFIECLNPSKIEYISRMEISTGAEKEETSIKIAPVLSKDVLKAEFPLNIEDKDLNLFAKDIIGTWVDNTDFGETYKNNFFRWWMKASVLDGDKWNTFPNEFKSALVEWMKVCPIEEARQAYVDLINNSKDKNIKRRNTEIETKEIIDHVNWGIKEFNIDLSDVQKGSRLISRYDD